MSENQTTAAAEGFGGAEVREVRGRRQAALDPGVLPRLNSRAQQIADHSTG